MPRTQHPTPIQSCLDRLSYDPSAKAELIGVCRDRVRLIVNRILRKYPPSMSGHRDDVEQETLVRLSRALDGVLIDRTRDFLALAATQVRRAVVDIIRCEMPRLTRPSRRAVTPPPPPFQVYRIGSPLPGHESPPSTVNRVVDEIDLLDLFEKLTVEERLVIDHIHFLGMTQPEMADELGIDPRTVRRWHASAKLHLAELLGFERRGENYF